MDHGPAVELGEDKASSYKSRLGVKLFIIYSIVYAVFVAINVASPETMEIKAIFNLNLAVTYGFFLILLAIIMGLFYNHLCTKAEEKLNIDSENGGTK